jgi:diguanylate cyclase (GGDEF)-like protein
MNRLALEQRIARSSLLGAAAALGLASLLLIVFQFITLRAALLEDLQVQARIIGSNSTAALLFADQRAGAEILAALEASPSVSGAYILSARGEPLASYQRNSGDAAGALPQAAPGVDLRFVDVREEVQANGSMIGSASIRASLAPLYRRLAAFAAYTLLVAAGSYGLAWLLVQRMRRSVRQAERRLHHLAHVDPVTSLPNRNAFNEQLARALAQCAQAGGTVGLLLLDLDNFKVVNDTLGHNAGDLLLQQVAQRLAPVLGGEDLLCRLGGDEFVLIVRLGQDASLLDTRAEHVLAALAAPFQLERHQLHVSASIGTSVYPAHAGDAQGLMRCADTAMYYAKNEGKNGYRHFQPEMELRALKRMQLEANLRRALAGDELSLHYQPQVDVMSGRVTGLEVLARWTCLELGVVSPAEFIPVAEESGVIVPLGRWVLETACRQCAAWHASGLLDGMERIAVNLSACQVRDSDLLADVDIILADTGLPRHLLELEITEGVLMDNVEATLELMQQLNQRGIQLSVDDFGTGYSSLSYLKRFPIDQLKIDRSFIHDVPGEGEAIASAIIAMAHSLRLAVVAEGVENAAQLEFLRRIGCDTAQGYYFSRPLPAPQLEQWLQRPAA